MSTLVPVMIHRNPFHPGLDVDRLAVRPRRRLRALAPKTSQPFICLVNGRPVLRAGWNYRVRRQDYVQFVILPQDGGDGGSNPLQLVLMFSLMAFAPWAAGALGFTQGTFAFAAVQAAIGLVGSMLINALVPPPKQNASQSASALASASPTYSLGAQGNTARLGQPIPVQYGRVQAFPDLGSDSYVEYAGNDQYLYQLLVLGQGSYSLESINLENTPVHTGTFPTGQFTGNGSFPEITIEVVQPHAPVTLFPANVNTSVEVTGQELLTGTAVGGFVANNAGTQANALGIDLVCPAGLYFANNDGSIGQKSVTVQIEAQLVDDVGVALGAWTTLAFETITAATPTPQRRSFRYNVTAGRYKVRCTRTDTKDTSAQAGHTVVWAALRAYLPDTRDYGNVTLIAMRMRATNNLSSQSSRRINVVATRKLAAWSPTTGWSSPAATRSIAWAIADAARASYGGNLPDSQIDLAGLYALDATWTSRGDHFDGRFDQKTVVWDGLTQITRAGRAKPFMQGGLVRIFRDGPATLPVGLFSMRNIVRGSFGVEYLMPTEQTADAVEVLYVDQNLWTEVPVLCQLPGSTASNPVQVKLFGVVDRAQAWREGMYMAACNRYRRRVPRFDAERDALIPSAGDLVAVAHDMPAWSQSGDVVAWNAGTSILTVSEPLTWASGVSNYIGLRRRDGSLCGPIDVTQVDAYNLHVTTPAQIDFTLVIDGHSERPHYSFGAGVAWQTLAKVISIKPKGQGNFTLETVIEDSRVHTADGGTPPALPTTWSIPAVPVQPQISGALNVVMGGTVAAPTLSASWNAAAGADTYLVEQTYDSGATPVWTRVAEVSKPEISFSTHPGFQGLRVAPMGASLGAWVVWTGTVVGGANLTPGTAPTGLTATASANSIFLAWDAYTYAGTDHIEILRNTANDPTTATVIDTVSGPVNLYADYIGSGGVTRYYWNRAVNTKGVAGALSTVASATTGVISATPPAGSIVHSMMAADAIWAANLKAGEVQTNHLAANIITAGSGKIANLAVDTLLLANNAVTIPVSAAAGSVSFGAGSVCVSAAINSTGAPISIVGCVSLYQTVTKTASVAVSLRRNGSVLFTVYGLLTNPGTVAQVVHGTFPLIFSETPGAGTYTYDIINSGVNSQATDSCSITLLETKK